MKPQLNEIVICEIDRIIEDGVYFKLNEYDDIVGFMLFASLPKPLYYARSKIFTMKKKYVMSIRQIHDDCKYDLSYDDNTNKEYLSYFSYQDRIYDIIFEFIGNSKLDSDYVWERTNDLWNKENIENMKNNYFNILLNPNNITKNIVDEYPDECKNFLEFIDKKITKKNPIICQYFNVSSYADNGNDIIKNALTELNLDIEYENSPKYKVFFEVKNFNANELKYYNNVGSFEGKNTDIDNIVLNIKNKCESYGLTFSLADVVLHKQVCLSYK